MQVTDAFVKNLVSVATLVCSTSTDPLLLYSPLANSSFTKESAFQAAGAGIGYCYLAGLLAAGEGGDMLVCQARGCEFKEGSADTTCRWGWWAAGAARFGWSGVPCMHTAVYTVSTHSCVSVYSCLCDCIQP